MLKKSLKSLTNNRPGAGRYQNNTRPRVHLIGVIVHCSPLYRYRGNCSGVEGGRHTSPHICPLSAAPPQQVRRGTAGTGISITVIAAHRRTLLLMCVVTGVWHFRLAQSDADTCYLRCLSVCVMCMWHFCGSRQPYW